MATAPACYNHDDRVATWLCVDCKPDSSVKYCKECHDNVHMLPVFRLHRTQTLIQNDKRRLSHDVSDLEKLVVVEKNILNEVVTTLRYTEQYEREMLQDIVKKGEQRLHDIQKCHEKVEKALLYLAKVSTAIASCSDSDIPPSQVPKRLATIANEIPEQQNIDGLPQFPVEIVGSLVKTGCFWMIRKTVADKQKLIKIEHELKEYFKENAPSPLSSLPLKEGTICAIRNHASTEFWRVRVEKLCPKEMVKVRYLDYGMFEEIPLSLIVDLPSAMRLVPFQAMECCLFPLTSKISLPYEAKWCFKDLTHGKDLLARVYSQMVYPQGYSMYHVQLTSTGQVPTNINQKVADLLAQTKMDEENQPILPKDEVQESTEKVQENKVNMKEAIQVQPKPATTEKQPITGTEKQPITGTEKQPITGNEKQPITATEKQPITESKALSPGEQAKKITILTRQNEDNLNNVAPKSPPDLLSIILGHNKQDNVVESSTGTNDVTNPSSDTNNGTVTKPTDNVEDCAKATGAADSKRPVNTKDVTKETMKPLEDYKSATNIKEFIPVGYVNQEMYYNLSEKYKNTDWSVVRNKVQKAVFFITKGSYRQFVEAIKTEVWCVLDSTLAGQINRVYKEQTERNLSLFLIFVHSSGFVLGLVEIVSEKKNIPHCSILIPGLMWYNQCCGEFNIKVISMNQFKFHSVDKDTYLWNFFKSYHQIGRELRYEKGQEIVCIYEHLKFYFPLVHWGLKHYQQSQVKEISASQENHSLSEDEHQLKGQEDVSAEDWECDLEAEPARVAEIYSNISSPPGSLCSQSEKPGNQEDFETLIEDQEEETKQETEQVISNDLETTLESEEETLDKTVILGDDETSQEDLNKDDTANQSAQCSTSELQTSDVLPGESLSEVSATQAASLPQQDQGSPEEIMEETSGVDIVSDDQNTQSQLSGDNQLSSVIPYEQAPPTNEHTNEPPNHHLDLPLQNSNPAMYYFVSPPHTPNTVVTTELQPQDQQEVDKDDIKVDNCVQNSAGEDQSGISSGNVKEGSNGGDNNHTERSESINAHGIISAHSVGGDVINVQSASFIVNDSSSNAGVMDNGHKVGTACEDGPESVNDRVSNTIGANSSVRSGVVNHGSPSSDNNDNASVDTDHIAKKERTYTDDDTDSFDDEAAFKFERFAKETDERSASAWVDSSSDGYDSNRASPVFDAFYADNQDEDAPFLPVEKGINCTILMVSEPTKDGMFTARLVRNMKEEDQFKMFEKELNKVGRHRERVSQVFLLKYCLFENAKGYFQRAQIRKMCSNKLVDVKFIDTGKSTRVNLNHLRELPDKYLTCMPPQAFLCKTNDVNSLMDKVKRVKKLRRGFDIDVHVKSITDEFVEVEVLNVRTGNFKFGRK